jgi:hypothetical protein
MREPFDQNVTVLSLEEAQLMKKYFTIHKATAISQMEEVDVFVGYATLCLIYTLR